MRGDAHAVRALEALVGPSLPDGVRLESARRKGPLVVMRWRDTAHDAWAIECWEGGPDRPWFKAGRALRCAYRGGVDAARAGRVADALLAHEDALLAWARTLPSAASEEERAGRDVFLREGALMARIARALPTTRRVAAAVHAVLDAEAAQAPAIGRVMLHLEAPCGQACEFCEEPGRRAHRVGRAAARALRVVQDAHLDLVSQGALDAMIAWCASRPAPVTIHVSGHDWLAHPHRARLLAALEANPGAPLELQGPSTALADPALARRVLALPHLRTIRATIQSADAAAHDAMVGTPGAHRALVAALDALRARDVDVDVELTIVLTHRALPTLAATLAWIGTRGLDAHLQAFLPDRGLEGAEAALPSVSAVRDALAGLDPGARDALGSLAGVPHCAVPDALRARLAPGGDASRRDALTYAGTCDACLERPRCPGVPAATLRRDGPAGLSPRR